MPKKKGNNGSQDRIQVFIQAYFYDTNNEGTRFNAYQSALKAGYSKGFANSRAPELVGNDRAKARNKVIFDAVQREREKIKSISSITPEDLMLGYKRELSFDIGDLMASDGTFKNPKDLPEHIRKSIYGIEINDKGGIKYKLPNKRANRQDLINWLFTEKKDDQAVNVSLKWAVFPAAPQSLEQWQQQTNSILNANNINEIEHVDPTSTPSPDSPPTTDTDTTTYGVPHTNHKKDGVSD